MTRRPLIDAPRYTPLKEDLGLVPTSVLDPWASPELRRRDTSLRALVGDTGELRDGSLRGKPTWVMTNTASVFSPVVCEILLKLWGPERGGRILDPFAGGGTRALISALNGFEYYGIELRSDEAERVRHQLLQHVVERDVVVITGDACDPASYPAEPCDALLTCPPYGDLEKYEGGPKDLSSLPHEEFLMAIQQVLQHTLAHVYEESFAVWVVGNWIDDDQYVDFKGELIRLAKAVGWKIHDDVVLVGKLGTAGQRVGNSWQRRRLVRRHEYAVVLRA